MLPFKGKFFEERFKPSNTEKHLNFGTKIINLNHI